MFLSEDGLEVVRVDCGVASIPPFRIDIPSFSESILPIRVIVHRDDTWARNRQNCLARLVSRSLTVDFSLSSLFTLFYFIFLFFFLFNFLFLEQLGLGVISYTVTSVTN